MTADDVARDSLLWVWAGGSNFVPAQFWNLYFLVSNPDAMEAVRQEVDTILSKRRPEDGPFDGTFTMDELESMVKLESAFKESIRLSMTALIARTVMQDMTIDLKLSNTSTRSSKYFLEKGSIMFMYPPILHHDPTVFEQPKEYRWNRFYQDETTGKAPKKFRTATGETIADPFRVFGGGKPICVLAVNSP